MIYHNLLLRVNKEKETLEIGFLVKRIKSLPNIMIVTHKVGISHIDFHDWSDEKVMGYLITQAETSLDHSLDDILYSIIGL